MAPSFDFAYMARWAAGPAYRTMNETQREVMARKIKHLLLGTLAKRLSVYDDQGMRLFHSRRVGRNEAKVTVGIMGSAGYPAKLIFRLYRGEAGWKVFDVAANGNSALAYYRRHFARKLAGRGH
ncbi:MlaC/ttg2D family ABC transporter substrate-binding protein [endosymbiont of Riftia pachyptila]|uniref:MlaC/ttg2D family ABC transporter substrate-binding protein n=1 Tax=endosymbiont of Riftia pachyptila TaxID=54396 RepID=UPI0009D6D63D|nr:ABC transporter substrate-binding protein [endosymbiont of Riftia pachyptila]